MKNLWNNVMGMLLMDAAKGDGSDGGSGGTSFLTPPEGGSKVPAAQGDAGAASGAAGDKSANNAGAGDASKGGNATDWRSSLPKELQEDASIKKFTDVSTLAAAYKNAQKLIGADKIPMPTKHTTEEEWTAIHRKLGLPEKIEEYDVKFKQGVSVDDKFIGDFKALAHKAGVLPKQAQALADWFSDINIGSEEAVKQELTKQFSQNVTDLKKEWGNGYELNVSRASKVINEIGGEDMRKHFNTIGVGGDKQFIKFLAKVGETLYAEHKFVEGQGTSSAMTPQEIDREIKTLQSQPGYFDKQHPMHKTIVADVQALFQQKFPTKEKA